MIPSRTSLTAAGLLVVGALVLTGCTIPQTGQASPVENSAPPLPEVGNLLEPSAEPADPSGSTEPSDGAEEETSTDPPADLEPNPNLERTSSCDLVSDELIDELGMAGDAGYRDGAEGRGDCILIDLASDYENGLAVSVDPYRGIDEWTLDGLIEASSTEVEGRAARLVRTSESMCAMDIVVTEDSSIRVLVLHRDVDRACELAPTAAQHVVRAVPAEAFG
ncbi:hypothetical protein FHR81_004231 [Actinoalloteichus hoggarensis]|uniref:DUF3558 family protein n=1 Tax=Actinoalloteichus hoggarensis TaxID=1470176 RepID=UPI0012FD2AA5|nr:DUF3558 family protein [Actinoalloteichus hoggarensis]MBB5923164.1 hypothetical protein [Actinoalloteichus hoggarensis]